MTGDKKKLADIEGEPLDRPNDGATKTATDERDGKNLRGYEELEKTRGDDDRIDDKEE